MFLISNVWLLLIFASLFFTFLKGKDPDIIKNTLFENLDADHNDEISFVEFLIYLPAFVENFLSEMFNDMHLMDR